MSINGVLQQPMRPFRSETGPADKQAPAPEPIPRPRISNDPAVIDIKAMKAILYLGIRGEVYLPLEEPHLVDTRA